MVRTDLKLLLDVDAVSHVEDGVYQVRHGERAAVTRLVRAGLLEQNPFDDRRVRITHRGEQAIEEIERTFEAIFERQK